MPSSIRARCRPASRGATTCSARTGWPVPGCENPGGPLWPNQRGVDGRNAHSIDLHMFPGAPDLAIHAAVGEGRRQGGVAHTDHVARNLQEAGGNAQHDHVDVIAGETVASARQLLPRRIELSAPDAHLCVDREVVLRQHARAPRQLAADDARRRQAIVASGIPIFPVTKEESCRLDCFWSEAIHGLGKLIKGDLFLLQGGDDSLYARTIIQSTCKEHVTILTYSGLSRPKKAAD